MLFFNNLLIAATFSIMQARCHPQRLTKQQIPTEKAARF
jgi:hypothetical protein